MLTINHALLKDLERFGDGRHRGVALHPCIETQRNKTLRQPGRSIGKQCAPAQIWLNDAAKARWKVEPLVLQPQSDGRWGLMVYGLDSGQAITPES